MKHVTQLDAFRAFSVMLVLFSHFVRPNQLALRDSFEWGRMGVLAFFVLSGFLITGILLEHRQRIESGASTVGQAWRSFIVRRTLRIFPLYFFALFFFGYVVGVQNIRDNMVTHALYVSNFGQALWGINYGIANHFWSLCVEEQFYLLWPFGMLMLTLEATRILCVLMLAVSTIFGGLWISLEMGGKFINYIPLGAPSFALCIGGLLAWQRKTGLDARPWNLALAVAVAAFACTTFWAIDFAGKFVGLVHDLSWSVVSAWIIMTLCQRDVPYLANPVTVWIGKISYGIYVYHLLLTVYFPGLLRRLKLEDDEIISAFLVKTAATIVVASISYLVLERPFLKLKVRFS
jgi:peptidoglycan/LPS O-acetylase OafA/YrhL